MLLSLLEKRRSIRRYQPGPVDPATVDRIVEAALRSPSSRSLNPWEFVVVTDAGLLERLAKAKPHGSAFIGRAPLGIVVCADPAKCDVWIEDASIASMLIHLAAASMGMGSCWIQIRDRMHDGGTPAEAHVREVLGLPERLRVLSMIAIGFPDEDKAPHPPESLQWEKVSSNRFGNRYRPDKHAGSTG